jgi:membrane fusion protein (multidrug efflux system)
MPSNPAQVRAQRRHRGAAAPHRHAEAQIEQAKAQAQGGKAQLALANVDVDATLIRATDDGRMGDKTVTPGQYVQAGTRLMTLVPLSKIYVWPISRKRNWR